MNREREGEREAMAHFLERGEILASQGEEPSFVHVLCDDLMLRMRDTYDSERCESDL